jgi:hypothetical protein
MNVKCFIVSLLLGLSLIISSNNAEATHHYLWSNTDYAFWLDDQSIKTAPDKSYCTFNIISEDMHTGEQELCTSPIIIYKRNSEWWLSFCTDRDQPPHEVEWYSEWWQPWGLKWLLDNGYLEE